VTFRKDGLAAVLRTFLLVKLKANRLVVVTADPESAKTVEEQFSRLAHVESYGFDNLCRHSTRAVSGRTLVLISPEKALGSAEARGKVDGGIAKMLAGRLWKTLVIFAESEDGQDAVAKTFPTSEALLSEVARRIHDGAPLSDSDPWLDELLLCLLYRRHLTLSEVLKILPNSVWYHKFRDRHASTGDALQRLVREKFVREANGRFSCTSLGMALVERGISFSSPKLGELKNLLDQELARPRVDQEDGPPKWWKEEREEEAETVVKQLVTDFLDGYDWITVKDASRIAVAKHALSKSSPAKVRRLLDEMVEVGKLTRLTYVRGVGRPTYIYRKQADGEKLDWLESTCGECALYIRTQRRCRLWWAVNRFSGNEIHSRWDQLPRMAHEKLRYGITGMGPKATACDYFAAKKKDFPLKNAPEKCLGCGAIIEPPLAKTVQCGNCGTKFKPVGNRILVLYDYEQLLRDRYSKIIGAPPPAGVLTPHLGEDTQMRKDLLVLYPAEEVRLGLNGISLKRRKAVSFQAYDRIYGLVDYGALSDTQVTELRERGLDVVRRTIQSNQFISHDALPDFSQKLRRLDGEEMTRAIAESLLRSVIIATRRVLTLDGRELAPELLRRQLLEYERFKQDLPHSNLDELLAYEARVSNQYWKAYKLRLRIVGLDFKSRVRDRFVREIVYSARARARGYSPVNAGINYLHQRRLLKCRMANAGLGLGWDGFEGLLHVARRKQTIGLLLDLSDQFKLADREVFLNKCSEREFAVADFVVARGRHGVRFYFPSSEAVQKLERAGQEADQQVFRYGEEELPLEEVYLKYAKSFVNAVETQDLKSFVPFAYGSREDHEWLRDVSIR